MKRGLLGNTQVDTANYWTDGKGSQSLKCNETNLYALIDLCQESAELAKNASERQMQYSLMDKYFLCLKAIELSGADDNLLKFYGQVIANMDDNGSFNIIFASLDEENIFVDNLVSQLAAADYAEETLNEEFLDWYKEVVLDYNYYQNADGTRTKTAPKLSGLGATYTDDYYSKKAKESGMALLYIACDKNKVLDGCTDRNEMMNKLLYQGQTWNWLGNCGTNMTKISVMANIKAGIKADSGKETADETLQAFKEESEAQGKQTKGLGFDPGTLAIVIITAVTVIVTLITSIIKMREAEATARVAEQLANAPNTDLVEQYSPQYQDYSDYVAEMQRMLDDADDMSALDILPIVGMGAIAVLALILAKRKDKS